MTRTLFERIQEYVLFSYLILFFCMIHFVLEIECYNDSPSNNASNSWRSMSLFALTVLATCCNCVAKELEENIIWIY